MVVPSLWVVEVNKEELPGIQGFAGGQLIGTCFGSMIGWLGKGLLVLVGGEMMKRVETNSYQFNDACASRFHRKSSPKIPNLL